MWNVGGEKVPLTPTVSFLRLEAMLERRCSINGIDKADSLGVCARDQTSPEMEWEKTRVDQDPAAEMPLELHFLHVVIFWGKLHVLLYFRGVKKAEKCCCAPEGPCCLLEEQCMAKTSFPFLSTINDETAYWINHFSLGLDLLQNLWKVDVHLCISTKAFPSSLTINTCISILKIKFKIF